MGTICLQEGCEENGSPDVQRRTPSYRTMQRMTSARDWTLDEAEGSSDELPAGFCKRCVRLAAPDALHPCNQQIPVTMVWHSDHQDFEAMSRALNRSSCDLPIEEAQDLDFEECPDPPNKLPVVIWLHGTNGNTGSMMPRLISYAQKGFLAVAIDFRCVCSIHNYSVDYPTNCVMARHDIPTKHACTDVDLKLNCRTMLYMEF